MCSCFQAQGQDPVGKGIHERKKERGARARSRMLQEETASFSLTLAHTITVQYLFYAQKYLLPGNTLLFA